MNIFEKIHKCQMAPVILLYDYIFDPHCTTRSFLKNKLFFWNFEDNTTEHDQRLPSSFLLELIVINEWKRAGSPQDFDLRKGFYHVLTAITNYRTMRLASTQNYTSHHCRYLYTILLISTLTKCQIWLSSLLAYLIAI